MAFRLANKGRLLKPGKCIICENTPQHRVVDTGYNLFATTVFEKLRGRKYICSGCGEKIGKALGMVMQPEVNKFKEEIIRLQNREAELVDQVKISEQISDLRSYLRGEVNATPAPVENEESAATGGD